MRCGSHLQPDRAHERQGIAVLDDARAHPVVEEHLAVDQAVGEMDVGDPRIRAAGELGQGEVVGRDHADGAPVDQALHDRLGADAAVVRIGAVEQLVEQEEERQRPAREVDQSAARG